MPDFRGLHGFGTTRARGLALLSMPSDVYRPVHGVSRRLMDRGALAHSRRPLQPCCLYSCPPRTATACDAMAFLGGLTQARSIHSRSRSRFGTFLFDTFLYTCLVRNLRGRGGDIAPSLYAGTETSFVELECLEFGAHHAADDDLHLLRDTENHAPKKIRERTELSQSFCTRARALPCCWSPVNKGKGSTGALRSIQRIVCRRAFS